MLTNKSKVMGLLFDVSLQHAPDGLRVLDYVKMAFADYLRLNFDHDDIFYLYHPHLTEVLTMAGDQTAAIQNYECDGYKIKLLQRAFLQIIYVISAEEGRRVLVYVTDRTSDVTALKSALSVRLNAVEENVCRFVVIGIGSGYDKAKYESLDVTLVHVDDPKDISLELNKTRLFEDA